MAERKDGIMHSLYIADHSTVHGVMLQSGLWPHIISAGATLKTDARALGCQSHHMLDTALVMGEVATLVCEAFTCDHQMLLWLATSTSLVQLWHAALAGLMVAMDETAPKPQNIVTRGR